MAVIQFEYFDVTCFAQGILENAIKITNEPPTGMHANLHAALDNFDQVSVSAACFVLIVLRIYDSLIYLFLVPSPGHPGQV